MESNFLADINKRIWDRSNCFYWQTDRKITVEEATRIWVDRHSLIKNDELLESANRELIDIKIVSIKTFDENDQSSNGSVNSLRQGALSDGSKVIIRCYPKGVTNGYYFVESLAASIALKNGIPAYKTYMIHSLKDEKDLAYQIIERMSGDTIDFYLQKHPEDEDKMVYEMGRTMAKLHKIKVCGFGPFNNDKAKNGELVGIHSTFRDAINAGLENNLKVLVENGLFSKHTADKIEKLFHNNNLLDIKQAVLVHNDFADWNLLTDGNTVSAVNDWDECVGGDPIEDIACWSLFFEPKRINKFLEGYFEDTKKYNNFEEIFQLMRLRYVVSKMTLRLNRYTYDQSEFMKNMIEKGKKHLNELIEIFDLDERISKES